VGHWEGGTVIGVNLMQAIVAVVDRKSGCAVIEKVADKTADLFSVAIVKRLKPFGAKKLKR
jgi:IS30 family transposase